MKEKMATPAHSRNVEKFLAETATRFAEQTAFAIRRGGDWQEFTFRQIDNESRYLALRLLQAGIQRGDRVAIFSDSRPEYVISFFAVSLAGAIAVPIDSKLTAEETTSILAHSDCNLILTSPEAQAFLEKLSGRPNSRREIWAILITPQSRAPSATAIVDTKVLESTTLQEDDVAIIAYTSGTTADAKGVMLRWHNILFEIDACVDAFGAPTGHRLLSLLPMSHMLEFACGTMVPFACGGTVNYANTIFPHEVVDRMAERQISYIIAVPLFFRALMTAIEKQVAKKRMSRLGFALLGRLARLLPSYALRRRLFATLHAKFGGKLERFISGGSPLDPDVQRFFETLGIAVLQGYGLTETSPVIAMNRPGKARCGSVGQPLKDIEVRINHATGEVLTRGGHVMAGYYKRDELTASVIDQDGWFHTGDLGHVDSDGYLHITGRKKDLIVLGSGKKVFPDEVESVLRDSPLIKDVCVLGQVAEEGPLKGTEVVCCVVIPADDLLRENPLQTDPKIEDPVRKKLDVEIKRLSSRLAQYKRPTRMILRTDDFPRTATRKMKRALLKRSLDVKGVS